jgi:CheY-like chemotaxis protein
MSLILITDDDKTLQRLLSISIKKAGFDIITANNGNEALKVIDETRPDLIVSDIMMPEMNGFEFCRAVRENPETSLVPFVFMTSSKDPELETTGFRVGADHFLKKPPERSTLIDIINKLLERNRALLEKDDSIEFQGELSELSIVEVIQLLAMNRRTGKVSIPDGYICFYDGQLWKTEYKSIRNELALNEILKLEEGTFQFKSGKIEGVCEFENKTMKALFEALRHNDN